MEPIRTTKTARLRRLEMYREDMDAFVAFFQDNCASFTIADGKNRYRSLDEMKGHAGTEVKDLDIRGQSPAVHFLLNRKEVVQGSSSPYIFNELRTEEISDEADSLFWRIQEFLEEHQRPAFRPTFLVPMIVSFICFFALTFHQREVTLLWLLGLFACALIFVLSAIGSFWFVNRITLEKRSLTLSFWKRNKDDIWLRVIQAFAGAVFGFIFGFILGRLSK
jgi:hypothetical protein